MHHRAHIVARLLGLCMLFALVGGVGRPAAAMATPAWSAATVDDGGSCSIEGETSMVVCGRALFAGVLDDRLLTMRSDVCDELLAGLFDRQACAMGDAGCHAMSAGALGPRTHRSVGGHGSSAADLAAAWHLVPAAPGRDWHVTARLFGVHPVGPEPPPPRTVIG